MTPSKEVFVVAVIDETPMRKALPSLLRSAGLDARTFTSAEEFLSSDTFLVADCVITDVRLPGMSGLELQQHLKENGLQFPVIIVTGQPDDDGRVQSLALRAGAVAFLRKPFDDKELLRAIHSARTR
jgi:two-component system, LuxR family, response regulator FixJ